MRIIVLVDGEHYPPVTRWDSTPRAIGATRWWARCSWEANEKLPAGAVPDLGVPTMVARADRMVALASAIDAFAPEGVLDLSDEPVLGYRERMELASVALARGIPYLGADFRRSPPIQGPLMPVPTLAVNRTGKRTGKTAIPGALARLAAERGLAPMIVAMGRGGPAEPQVAEADLLHRPDRRRSSGRASTRHRITWRMR